jgi:glutaredoxin 3
MTAPQPRPRLYSAAWCGYCRRVVDKLEELGVEYEYIEVPVPHARRREVVEVSGQSSVPVFVDEHVVLDDDDTIVPYLERRYGKSSDAAHS